MDNLLIHPKTLVQINAISASPPHAVLISGTEGSGKETLALQMAAMLLGTNDATGHPYFLRINPESESIAIDDIRNLQQFLKLKLPKQAHTIGRIVLIDRAERMRTEAQNALLKTLEEPPTDTCIMLTANSPEGLLSTITSRTQSLPILPVSQKQALEYFTGKDKKSTEIQKYYALSQGQVGLLYSLLYDEEHPLIAQVNLAKQIMAEPIGGRLLRTDELSKDKQAMKLLLSAFSRIAHAALVVSAAQGKDASTKQWHKRQAAIAQASSTLIHNPNTKLLLDDLFLSL